MNSHYKLIGVGIGPFNLSLAALLGKVENFSSLFLDQKPQFEWHPEIMFSDSYMQTCYLKDLVTPVDPSSAYSFLNYLVQKGLFYSFLNTNRRTVSRREFEMYCQWVSQKLGERLKFNSPVTAVDFDGKKFVIQSQNKTYTSDHLCVATGLTPYIPACATDFMGPHVFHAKSPALRDLDLRGKSLVIVGGGQTGIEIFRNAFTGKWGRPESVKLVTGRHNLEPLDETAFTNEYFTPSYVNEFLNLTHEKKKAELVHHQKLASDGNTPEYLEKIYNDLYQLKYVKGDTLDVSIFPHRKLNGMTKIADRYCLLFENGFLEQKEEILADIIILSTGFKTKIPKFIKPLTDKISFDPEGRFVMKKSFALQWDGPAENRIYALNFSRHHHGTAEAQTSLMAWRSAIVVNDLLQESVYLQSKMADNFISYS